MLDIIKNFRSLKYDALLMLYKALVRSHLEYANSVCNPHHIQQCCPTFLTLRATFIISRLAAGRMHFPGEKNCPNGNGYKSKFQASILKHKNSAR